MPDRLEKIKQIIREQGECAVISLRRDDAVWLIGLMVQLSDEVERLRDEVEKHKSHENELMGVLDQIDQKTFDLALKKFHTKVGETHA
ncbi:hypothetical protein [Sporolactobacillus laevolacticus]|uniref:Uncharacterized protein n=1 Tax=Sporolactobacillus laevolacticus DSM 442 TaxID=1395513 RepID=V6IXB7_9BACL|nr:hypothetical protein [Sporolactobacillus laevolacticus]EST11271.1 hypothetical protein P343_12750 [Sporolactobacillus laevolacticus DSM 442]